MKQNRRGLIGFFALLCAIKTCFGYYTVDSSGTPQTEKEEEQSEAIVLGDVKDLERFDAYFKPRENRVYGRISGGLMGGTMASRFSFSAMPNAKSILSYRSAAIGYQRDAKIGFEIEYVDAARLAINQVVVETTTTTTVNNVSSTGTTIVGWTYGANGAVDSVGTPGEPTTGSTTTTTDTEYLKASMQARAALFNIVFLQDKLSVLPLWQLQPFWLVGFGFGDSFNRAVTTTEADDVPDTDPVEKIPNFTTDPISNRSRGYALDAGIGISSRFNDHLIIDTSIKGYLWNKSALLLKDSTVFPETIKPKFFFSGVWTLGVSYLY